MADTEKPSRDSVAGTKSPSQLEADVPSVGSTKETDPDVVNWDGPDDPQNPMNWSTAKKGVSIAIVSTMTLLSPIASTICSSAAPDILAYFNETNETLLAFVTTVFLLGYVFGPAVIAPLSEIYGRSILYKVCIVLFLVFNVACAVAPSLGSLIAFRFLAGVAGSCPVTLGTGSIADMTAPDKRAGATGAYIIGAVLGPSIGPIAGGYLAPALGWRWDFWLMSIITAPVLIVVILFTPESYPFVLLKRKTERLRKETGNMNLRSALDTGRTPRDLFAFSILRPLKMLLLPIVFLLSLYVSVVYSYLYLCFTTFPAVFGGQYGFGSGASGLVTLGIGVGSIVGVGFTGAVADRLSKYLTEKNGGDPKPEYRLPTVALGGFIVPIGLFIYAWTAQYKTHWIVPIIGTAFLGCGLIMTYMATTMYLVDAYTEYAASVTASSTILRCLFGTFLPLAGPAMYQALGVGWGTSVLGFISLAFIPLPFIFYRFGQRIRETKRIQINI
ncbi:major facilitator superfamily domain-containing protein [Ustulina deusta]|nr:major facilitator superfamily domain-containing protein [Ustulina deusta]